MIRPSQKARVTAARLFDILPVSVILLVPVIAALWGHRSYITEFVASFSQTLLLVYVSLFLFALGTKRANKRIWLTITSASAIVFLVLIFKHQWPGAQPTVDAARTLRLIQINGGHIADTAKAVAWIDRQKADVIFLAQARVELVEHPALKAAFPHGAGTRSSHRILSRHPLKVNKALQDQLGDRAARSKSNIIVELQWLESTVMLVSPRISSARSHSLWMRSYSALLNLGALVHELLDSQPNPVIVAGDFNSTPFGKGYLAFKRESGLSDAARGTFRAGTWPSPLFAPLGIAIDHVFISDQIHVQDYKVAEGLGGDHRPITVDLRIPI